MTKCHSLWAQGGGNMGIYCSTLIFPMSETSQIRVVHTHKDAVWPLAHLRQVSLLLSPVEGENNGTSEICTLVITIPEEKKNVSIARSIFKMLKSHNVKKT